jgi:alkylhydroperoxidase/carboxymuconolactone decarboxylase family protein YurZ
VSDDDIWPRLERPNVEDRLDVARDIRERMGIYGEAGQTSEEFLGLSRVHTQGIMEWCFGMVWAAPPLDLKTKEIVTIATMIAQDFHGELEWHVRAALNLGLTQEEIIGVIVQATPYVGLPRANHALKAAMRAFKGVEAVPL